MERTTTQCWNSEQRQRKVAGGPGEYLHEGSRAQNVLEAATRSEITNRGRCGANASPSPVEAVGWAHTCGVTASSARYLSATSLTSFKPPNVTLEAPPPARLSASSASSATSAINDIRASIACATSSESFSGASCAAATSGTAATASVMTEVSCTVRAALRDMAPALSAPGSHRIPIPETRSTTPKKSAVAPAAAPGAKIGSCVSKGFRRSLAASDAVAADQSAPSRSILLMKATAGTLCLRACRQTVSVCACAPATASTISTAPSRTRTARSTSTVKSTCPGVSMSEI
eukprot:scaffold50030_cov27-Tisochrysis_lutea.AAC.4